MKEILNIIATANNESELSIALDAVANAKGKIYGANANRVARAIAARRATFAS